MNTLDEIKHTLERLSSAERESIAAWIRDFAGGRDRIAEPAAAYGAAAAPWRLSVEEYLEFEAASESRHEYVAGEVFAMSGASLRHNRIATNLFSAISSHLRGGPCEAFVSDVKVRLRINHDDIFYYPDVMVVCGRQNMEEHYASDPRLIVEVLAPSTEMIDRREKALNYRQLPSLEEYVLVAQRAPEVTIYRRGADWEPQVITAPEAVARLHSIELPLPLAQIYDGAW